MIFANNNNSNQLQLETFLLKLYFATNFPRFIKAGKDIFIHVPQPPSPQPQASHNYQSQTSYP